MGYKTYARTDSISYEKYGACTNYEPIHFPADVPKNAYNKLDVGPFTLVWGDDYTQLRPELQDLLPKLKSDSAERRKALATLNGYVKTLREGHGIDVESGRANDGKCYRHIIYLKGAGLSATDYNFPGGGNTSCDFGGTKGMAFFDMGVGVLAEFSEGRINGTFAHEATHLLQCKLKGNVPPGWDWFTESYANYMGNEISKNTVGIKMYNDTAARSIGTSSRKYLVWPFWSFLNQKFHTLFMWDLMIRKLTINESLFEYLRRTMPFQCSVGDNECRKEEFSNFYGRFAESNATYAIYTKAQGLDYIDRATDIGDGMRTQIYPLQSIGEGRYRSVDWLAPQRFGHNIIPLVMSPSADTIKINFTGWQVPLRESEWRYSVVATLEGSTSANPVEAYAPMYKSGEQTILIKNWESKLGAKIKKLHLVVSATPKNWLAESALSAETSYQRYRELDRFVYEVSITGAWPEGHEPKEYRQAVKGSGHSHPNGGGFVANTAMVDATAYVGPMARVLGSAKVLGNARIEGRAVITHNAIVKDNAIVSSNALMFGDAIAKDYATVRDAAIVRNTSQISENAKIQGQAYAFGPSRLSGKSLLHSVIYQETIYDVSISGTAIHDGSRYNFSNITQGTGYNQWKIPDGGTLLNYDFSNTHPYRIKDIHGSSDAYYLGLNGRPLATPTILADTKINANALTLPGNAYIELPKLALDQSSYRVDMQLNWTGAANPVTLLDASTERPMQPEGLSLRLIPLNDSKFDIKFTFKDRNAVTTEFTLNGAALKTNNWMYLSLKFDHVSSKMTLSVTPIDRVVGGVDTISASTILPSATREFDYDTLKIHLGADKNRGSAFNGKIANVKIVR